MAKSYDYGTKSRDAFVYSGMVDVGRKLSKSGLIYSGV